MVIPIIGLAQEKKKFKLKFSGFVKTDIFYDSRQTVSVREGHFLLYPKNELPDPDGADINAKDENGWTPLELAIFFGRAEAVQVLWLAGAEVNTNAMIGWTALHLAALLGTPESIMALLSAGADATLTNDDGETPFDLAQYNENVRDTAAYWALNWSLNEPVYN